MKEVYEFLKKVGTYYLGTVDNNKARVRPFGTIDLFENKLYIQTGKIKEVSKQIHSNPFVEICAFDGDKWLRVSGELKEDERIEAKKHMLDNYPMLRGMYNELDSNTEVFYFVNATATFSSFKEPSRTIKF